MCRVNCWRENQTNPDTLQEDFQTISEFVRRTDDLSHRMGLNLSEIHGVLGISKAMVFAYRSGKSRVTGKVWRKLEDAERAAGIATAPPGENAESSGSPKESGIGDPAYVMREEPGIYRVKETGDDHRPPLQEGTLDERVERLERVLAAIQEVLRNL